MQIFTDHWAEIDGLLTRYWEEGNEEPIVCFLHGLGGSIEAWHKTLGMLGAAHHVLAVDLPGCGCTQRPSVFPEDTLGVFAHFVAQFFDMKAHQPGFLVGHSLGGTVALEFALRYPDRLRGLVLVASAGFATDVALPLRLASLPGVGEFVLRPNWKVTERSLRSLAADPAIITEDEIDAAYYLASLPGAQYAFLDLLRVYCDLSGLDRGEVSRIVDGLSRLDLPVLIIWGDRDMIIPIDAASVAMARLPMARMVVLEGCGHVPMIETPLTFSALVELFFQQVMTGTFVPSKQPQTISV